MVAAPPEPTKDEIDELRRTTLHKLEADGLLNTLDEVDVIRFKKEDDYLRRFLMHHDNDQKLAQAMAIDTLKWRKEVGANDINEDTVNSELLKKGSLDVHNRDIDGCKMLVFTVRRHIKGEGDIAEAKRILIYWIERLEREEKGKWITVFFDMRDTGIKNMDMDFIQYLINLFKCYYPWILNYIIVFEMPWLLNAMWKIIKGWLPPKSIEKIKFVDRKAIQTYVPADQCLEGWGGTDAYEFKFESENKDYVEPIMNGDIEGKKVHFAEASSSTLTESIKSSETFSFKDGVKFQIQPQEELVFNSNKIGTSTSIIMSNKFTSRYAFKIKTTSPDKYRVRPSMGVIEPDCHAEVMVTLSEQLSPGLLVKDKFLVIALPCSTDTMSQQEFAQLQKNTNKLDVFEIRLRVGVVNTDIPVETSNNSAASVARVPPEVMAKIDKLLTKQSVLEEKLSSMRRIVYVILCLMIALLFVFVITTNNLTSSLLAQTTSAHMCLKGSNTDEL